jgi:hypothetical protein
MARSLTVKHEEKASTSPLLNIFLLLAFGWMGLTAIASSAAEPSAPVATP